MTEQAPKREEGQQGSEQGDTQRGSSLPAQKPSHPTCEVEPSSQPPIIPIDKHMEGREGMKPAGRRTRQEIEQIKSRIQASILAGYTPTFIAERLGIPRATIYRYLAELAQETMEHRLKKTDQLLHTYFNRVENLINELDIAYNNTKDPQVLAAKNKVIQDSFDRLQRAGFLPRVQDTFNIIGTQNNMQKTDIRVLVQALKDEREKQKAVVKA
jgi:AcrR family transcriptional regulator